MKTTMNNTTKSANAISAYLAKAFSKFAVEQIKDYRKVMYQDVNKVLIMHVFGNMLEKFDNDKCRTFAGYYETFSTFNQVSDAKIRYAVEKMNLDSDDLKTAVFAAFRKGKKIMVNRMKSQDFEKMSNNPMTAFYQSIMTTNSVRDKYVQELEKDLISVLGIDDETAKALSDFIPKNAIGKVSAKRENDITQTIAKVIHTVLDAHGKAGSMPAIKAFNEMFSDVDIMTASEIDSSCGTTLCDRFGVKYAVNSNGVPVDESRAKRDAIRYINKNCIVIPSEYEDLISEKALKENAKKATDANMKKHAEQVEKEKQEKARKKASAKKAKADERKAKAKAKRLENGKQALKDETEKAVKRAEQAKARDNAYNAKKVEHDKATKNS